MSFKERCVNWFNARHLREQYLLLGIAALIVIYALYLMIWHPISAAKERLVINNRLVFDDLEAVQALAVEYQNLKRTGSASAVVTGQNLSQIIDTSVAQHQLTMSRFQPSATGDVQIRFENMVFNNIIAWLYDLESTYAVGVKDISISPGNASGLVNVSVRLYRDG